MAVAGPAGARRGGSDGGVPAYEARRPQTKAGLCTETFACTHELRGGGGRVVRGGGEGWGGAAGRGGAGRAWGAGGPIRLARGAGGAKNLQVHGARRPAVGGENSRSLNTRALTLKIVIARESRGCAAVV